MTNKNNLQIHFTSSQWIKRMMDSGPEMVIWSVVVVECWICGRDLGQKHVSFSDFRATILPAEGQMTQEYKNNLQIHFTSPQWIKRMMKSGPEMVIWFVAVVECWICGRDLGQKQESFQTSEPQSSLPMAK
jgi:DNA-directed RNA polymerase subunit N (RpoN/RPB10)